MGDTKLRALLIGDSTVGKTSLLLRWTEDSFSDNPSTNGDQFKVRTLEVDGQTVEVTLRDTEGEERFSGNITCSQYRGMNGVLITYDVANKTSFENIGHWLGEINRYASNNMVIMIVGNKTDKNDERIISREDGEAEARKLGYPYFETSAKSNEGVEEVFTALIREILAKRVKPPDPSAEKKNTLNMGQPTTDTAPPKKKKCNLY
jgi:small GTP-binding protein